MIADWSNLPVELLELIVRRLHFVEDYVRFGMVCNSWRRGIDRNGCSLSCSFLPWLMLTQKMDTNFRTVCYPYKNMSFQLELPEIRDKRCWGSSFGWLVTLGSDFEMHLFNPLTCVEISLPPLQKCANLNDLICTPKRFRDYFVYKAVLSSSPSSSDCVVLAVYSETEKMAIAKLGGDTWTPLECSPGDVDDAICFDQNVYSISNSGDIVICDFDGSFLKKIVFTPLQEVLDPEYVAAYLVELGGEIYVISRFMHDTRENDIPFRSYLRTGRFNVYKLDICNEKWAEVQSLGDWSIFIGNNHSFSICCTDYPDCASSCVYFTDDYSGVSRNTPPTYDIGIYSLKTLNVEPFAQDDISVFSYSTPLWLKPSLA